MHHTDYSGESEENYSMRSDPPLLYESYEKDVRAPQAQIIEAVDVSSSYNKVNENESDNDNKSLD
jgi:hypothetical protein